MNNRTITLILTIEEQSALRDLIDAALRHTGIGGVTVASHFLAKMETAVAANAAGAVGLAAVQKSPKQ